MSRNSRHNDKGASPVNLGLIITPMLDMSFQILAFFIMVYNPSIALFESHIDGKLVPPTTPLVKGSKSNTPVDTPLLSESDPEVENSMLVIVKAIPKGVLERGRQDGEPAQIYVKMKEDGDPTLVADTNETIEKSIDQLQERLTRTAVKGAKNSIRLECQHDLKHQYVMAIYDACKSAGYHQVAFVAPAAEKKE